MRFALAVAQPCGLHHNHLFCGNVCQGVRFGAESTFYWYIFVDSNVNHMHI